MALATPYKSYTVKQLSTITIISHTYASTISLKTLGQMNINANLIASAAGGTVNISSGNFTAAGPTITATNVNITETSVTSLVNINTNWINGTINLNNNGALQLTTPANSYFVLTANIVGAGGTTDATVTLTSSNAGSIQFGGVNTYTGVTTINGGAYVNSYNGCATNATCTTKSYFVVNNGGVFQYEGNSYFYANAATDHIPTANTGWVIDLNGITVSDGGARYYGIKLNGETLKNTSSTQAVLDLTYAGAFSISANSIIDTSSGDIVISGPLTGSGNLSKTSSSALKFVGNSSATYSGDITISAGSVGAYNNGALGIRSAFFGRWHNMVSG